MGIEFELKFRATPEILSAVEASVPGAANHFQMETVYYDTPSQAFAAKHFTLRRRLENGVGVCTLKTPAGGNARREFETEAATIEAAIPVLCKLSGMDALSAMAAEGLQPVCGAKFHRIAKTLVLENCTLELALDQGVLMGGAKEQPLCELEVELKSGVREDATAYAAQLAKKYCLEAEPLSKFARARQLSQQP